MFKLICIDMDGTLLDRNLSIPDENIRVLREAIKRGVEIAIVSGRPYNVGRYFANMIGPEVHVIGSNGTYFKYKDITYEKVLSREQIKQIYEVVCKYELTVYFKTHNKLIGNKSLDMDHPYRMINLQLKEEDQMQIIENASLDMTLEAGNGEIIKAIAFYNDKKTNDRVINAKEELKQHEDLEVVSSHESNFEVMTAGASKGVAVKELSHHLGFDQSEIMCIGDNENDISMVKYAGLGVAMENGSKEIKEAADYITDTNENAGVAKAVLKFVLTEESKSL